METQLQINSETSYVTATAEALSLFTSPTLSDNTRSLTGTIDLALAFGLGGGFPEEGEVGIPDAEISVLGPLNIVLGQPPAFFATVDINNLLANISTPDPTPTMTLIEAPDPTYSLDASQFSLLLPEGDVHLVSEGSVDETRNLASFSRMVSGSAPLGTLGRVTLIELGEAGLYQQFDVQLSFPISFKTRLTFAGSINVDVDFEGEINASKTAYLAPSGIPGDFNEDLHVLGDDLPVWESGFGNEYGGGDLMMWQRHFGMAPPTGSALTATPEPTTGWLIAAACAIAVRMRRAVQRTK